MNSDNERKLTKGLMELEISERKLTKGLMGLMAILGTAAIITTPSLIKTINEAEVRRINTQTFYHPDFLKGDSKMGKTTLTDIDFDGKWDIAEVTKAGFTQGSGVHRLYFKKGYGPARSIETDYEFVEEEFFEPYQ